MKKMLSVSTMYIRHASEGSACMGRVYSGNAFNYLLLIKLAFTMIMIE